MGICSSNHTLSEEEVKQLYKTTKAYVPNIHKGIVVKVYDGDTITIVSMIEKKQYKFRIRLYGIDTPEMKSTKKSEIKIARLAQQWLETRILGKTIYLKTKGNDKYGRLLADIYDRKNENKSLNQMLIDRRLAVQYDGGTKTNVKNWETYYKMGLIYKRI